MQQSRNFSIHGAVDLGARQAAAKRQQEAPAANGDSGFVMEVTDATFNTDVVARSQSVPVILDLWAEWCGPCKQLGPVLEQLAAESAGAWVLAKVDVDANPQVSAALQVQSIPMVIAWIGGQPVDGFLGALPEAQVREWVSQIVQAAEQLGMPAGAGAAGPDDAASGNAAGAAGAAGAADGSRAAGVRLPGRAAGASPAEAMLADPRLKAAQDAMDAGDLGGATNALEQVLADSPGHPIAKAWLAQVELFRRVNSYDQAKVLRSAREHPDDPQAQAAAADVELVTGQIEASFDRLLGVVGRTSGDDRNSARLHLLNLFDILPPRDPRVTKARARLSALLF